MKIIVAVVLGGVFLAGCSSSTASHPVSHPSSSSPVVSSANPFMDQGSAGRPANPVPILRKTGAKQTAGSEVSTDIYGDRYATGDMLLDQYGLGTEDVTVDTYASQAAMDADMARNSNPSDGSRVIYPTQRGALWTVWVTPVTDMNGNDTFPVPLQTIADRVGGVVEKN